MVQNNGVSYYEIDGIYYFYILYFRPGVIINNQSKSIGANQPKIVTNNRLIRDNYFHNSFSAFQNTLAGESGI